MGPRRGAEPRAAEGRVAPNTTPAEADQAPGRVAPPGLVGRRDAALESGPPVAMGVAKVPGTVTVSQVTVPLLDVVDGPAPTANRAAHPGARGDATVIVRVVGYAVTAQAPQVAATGGAPRAHAGLQAEAAALTAVGAPVASLPARPVPLEVAPVAARKDTPATVAPGVPVLLGRERRPSRASGRAPRVHVKAAARVGSRSMDGPAPAIGPVDLGPAPAPGVAQAEPTRA